MLFYDIQGLCGEAVRVITTNWGSVMMPFGQRALLWNGTDQNVTYTTSDNCYK